MNAAGELGGGIVRVIGRYPADADEFARSAGPALVVVGGIHGNEPAGVEAARRVLEALTRTRPRMRGRFLALAGNVAALRTKRRYVDRDLNRIWTDEEVAELQRRDPSEDDHEGGEQRALLRELDQLLAGPCERIVMLDLHSISADGGPFVIMADTLQNRVVGFELGVPVILGLEESVTGTLLSYVAELGHVAVCLEGGQNDCPSTIDHHEAAVWVTLVKTGLLARRDVPDLSGKREVLAGSANGLPRVLEIRHRHAVREEAPFEMLPGFRNFRHVTAGEVLARERTPAGAVEVCAPEEGLLLMPRYQGQGADGFFIGRSVRPFWLRLSALLRRAGLERVLPLLPGVRRQGRQLRVLTIEPHVARWFVLEILHLFGYRRAGREGHRLVFVRRRDA